jgi:hypothetical protein
MSEEVTVAWRGCYDGGGLGGEEGDGRGERGGREGDGFRPPDRPTRNPAQTMFFSR